MSYVRFMWEIYNPPFRLVLGKKKAAPDDPEQLYELQC